MIWLFAALASAVCADGVLDAGEACDDYNLGGGDGCDASCAIEHYYECAEPPAPFAANVTWAGAANCATSPVRELVGIGSRLNVPDWPVFVAAPTGQNCWSAWSTGDAGSWLYGFVWQGGPLSTGVGGSFGSPAVSLAACKTEQQSASFRIEPQGQTALYFGMRDSPCSDNRGSLILEVRAVSSCVWDGDWDEDGVLNDDDACPTVYNHLPEPFAFNEACVSELASWDGADVGRRALVHRDAVIDGVIVGAYAEIGRQAEVGSGSVVGRRALVGERARLGEDALVASFARVGDDVQTADGAPVLGFVLGYNSEIDNSAHIGSDVVIGNYTRVGKAAAVGSSSVLLRYVVVGDGSQVGARSLLAPNVALGSGTLMGERVRLRSNVRLGALGTVGAGATVGRDTTGADRVNIGASAQIRRDVTLNAGAVVPAGAYVAAGSTVN